MKNFLRQEPFSLGNRAVYFLFFFFSTGKGNSKAVIGCRREGTSNFPPGAKMRTDQGACSKATVAVLAIATTRTDARGPRGCSATGIMAVDGTSGQTLARASPWPHQNGAAQRSVDHRFVRVRGGLPGQAWINGGGLNDGAASPAQHPSPRPPPPAGPLSWEGCGWPVFLFHAKRPRDGSR